MKKLLFILLLAIISQPIWAQIIDVHTHSYIGSELYPAGILNGLKPAKSADLHLRETIAEMDKNNIKFSVVSGSIESVEKYVKADARFIPGYSDIEPMGQLMPIAEFEQFIIAGRIKVFGEIGSAYHGRTLNDPMYAPYLKICEKYDIPVGYHTGGSFPEAYLKYPKFRMALGDPLLIEDVLVDYPKLRVYLMHGGANYFENTVTMIDVAVLLWTDKTTQNYAIRLLKLAKESEVLDRIMFGSDPMVWPGALSKSVEFLNAQPYLSDKEKRMIFYENAKTFLKL
jgi:predicted TIM-barrel fold metal-dependent hydrolase